MNRTSRRPNGFTLVEALIATAILSLIVSVIYASFSTTGNNIEQAESARDLSDLGRTLTARLANDIANAYYNPAMPESIFRGKKGEDSADKIRFDSIGLTTLTNWRRPNTKETDLWEVGYRFEQKPDGTGMNLVRREKRELKKEPPPLEGGDDYLLTDRVAGLQLRYYDGASWTDEWDSNMKHALPREVEIQIALNNGASFITHVEVGR